MIGRERGSASGDHVLKTCCVKGQNVEVSFDQNHFIGFANVLLGLKNSVSQLRLMKDKRLGAVQVLRTLAPNIHRTGWRGLGAPSKAHYFSASIQNWKHRAVSEQVKIAGTITALAFLTGLNQSQLDR